MFFTSKANSNVWPPYVRITIVQSCFLNFTCDGKTVDSRYIVGRICDPKNVFEKVLNNETGPVKSRDNEAYFFTLRDDLVQNSARNGNQSTYNLECSIWLPLLFSFDQFKSWALSKRRFKINLLRPLCKVMQISFDRYKRRSLSQITQSSFHWHNHRPNYSTFC